MKTSHPEPELFKKCPCFKRFFKICLTKTAANVWVVYPHCFGLKLRLEWWPVGGGCVGV